MSEEKLKRGDLREALIAYAEQATKEGTISSMSLRAAARDLGVSSGAVYRHFVDKDALMGELAWRGFERLRLIFSAIRPKDSPATSIDQAIHRGFELVRAYIHFAQENPSLWHIMFGRIGVGIREDMLKDPEFCEYTAFDVSLENIRDLWRLGALDHEPSLDDVRYMWSATHGAADLAITGARMDFEDIEQICVATAERNIRAVGFKPAS